ncbi:L-ascorbate peroxidase [Seminavis robusta]|uniref:L-ascorbate peroxidase n=1 Tax=Seminavis robusta TaxID=568900 RepID=A0A9N8D8U9_9STRA|nr:L-ascorbate peroxidase [Seminavis robusta]|eukprot:Sro1_g000190.1 L-ascorbate peroxidase (286) ;mRNA; f:64714-65571
MIPPLRAAIHSTLEKDPGLAGPLIRLAFHDATTWEQTKGKEGIAVTTGGPNGSVRYELDWNENRALSGPLAIVEEILEQTSPSITLADVIAVAGATAIEHAGGPRIALRLGRRDVNSADPHTLREPMEMETERSKITSTMPSPAMDSDGLRLYFGKRLHLREEEFVALSGVHGLGRHVTLLGMPKSCLKNLTRTCLEEAPQSLPFVSSSVDRFSNGYFQYLLRWYDRDIQLGDVAFIPTDVALAVDPGLRRYVKAFARDEPRFFRTFARAYQKLVEVTATSSKRY